MTEHNEHTTTHTDKKTVSTIDDVRRYFQENKTIDYSTVTPTCFCVSLKGTPSVSFCAIVDDDGRVIVGYDRLLPSLKSFSLEDADCIIRNYFADRALETIDIDDIAKACEDWVLCTLDDMTSYCPVTSPDITLPCTEDDIDNVIRDGIEYIESSFNLMANRLECVVYECIKQRRNLLSGKDTGTYPMTFV